MSTRFQVGDIISLEKYWDHGEGCFLSGVIEITSYEPHYTNTLNGIYEIRTLKGNIGWTSYNSSMFDVLPYLVFIGNIYTDRALRLLYGKV